MPIYEQGYRRYEARGPLRSARFWPITREALRLVFLKRAFLLLMGAAWIQFAGRLVQILVITRFPEAGRVLPIDGRLFGEFLAMQGFWTLLLCVFAGAGLVANDLRTGAILVYLSRPLTRRDYVLGKLGVLMALNLGVTLVPGLLLYVLGLGLAPEQYLKWELWWIAPAVVLQASLMSLTLAAVALAVSALSKTARSAGLAFFGLMVGLDIARGILVNVVRAEWASLLSLQHDLEAVAAGLFGIQRRDIADPWWAAATLVAATLAALAVLRARVRAVEIVR
jgi:ABC-2 type transport system permease protein